MTRVICFATLFIGILLHSNAIPPVINYAGQVSVDGETFEGTGSFKFALLGAKGKTTLWSNDGTSVGGTEPKSSVSVSVNGGLYSILLGNIAIDGMGPIDPAIFTENSGAKLRVWFSDGVNGFERLKPDRPFASVPYAFSAGNAKLAESVKLTPGTITKQMLSKDVLSDLNRTITPNMIKPSSITPAQLNDKILKYLKPEINLAPQAPGMIFKGQQVTLNAQAEGKFLKYQWLKNGKEIKGATKDRLVIKDVKKKLHDGNYSLVVSNDFGSVTTLSTFLVVDSTPTTHTVLSANNMEMIFCPPGKFTMGSPTTEAGRGVYESPHEVTLTNGFYLGKYEVTQAQYETVMTGNSEGLNAKPSNWPNNNDRPIENVSWNNVQVFLSRLNDIEETAGRLPAGWKYVLPTEAQWEYACRAGTTTVYSWGNDINSSHANYNWDGGVTSGVDFRQTRDVGMYDPNPWGFFDMHGNVWEWVYDWKADYPGGSQINPEGPASGFDRVSRGGSWHADGTTLRSAKRNHSSPGGRNYLLGFRLAFQAMPADSVNPELELFGGTAITREAGQAWVEPGVEAHDARDGNITDQIVVTGSVDMNSTGNYILTYTVQDAAGNKDTKTRTVTVRGTHTVDLNATVAMDMIWCPPGTFTMGSNASESGRRADENETVVHISKGFFLGKYEVTNEQWAAIYGSYGGPDGWVGLNLPATMVSWENAQDFIARLNENEEVKNNLPEGWSYSLPTEAEWEYACKAGSTTRFSWGNDINSSKANYNWSGSWNSGDDAQRTISVGQFSPNQWGFYDMHGNVLEWTLDWYGPYPNSPSTDPKGPSSGSQRVNRGGSWFNGGNDLRSSRRPPFPTRRSYANGFRLALKFDAQE